jgi:ABC-2 type transport system ATP-binding protein
MPAKVIVRDLKKHYDGVEAARGVSFDIEDGEIFGLIGPNGAGKTTTLECVIGLREPDSGRIEICGIDARQHPFDVKEKIGAALQTTSLQDKITPREALALFASFYRQRTVAAELLERFGLTAKADAPFDTLSGGQRQRLALALAFVNRPELVFLDEPTSALDAQSRRDLHREILRMKADGHTVLLTTHDPLHRRGRSPLRPGRGDPHRHDRRDRRHARAHGTVLRLAIGDRHRHAAAGSRRAGVDRRRRRSHL